MAEAEFKSQFGCIKHIPYLTLRGKLCDAFWEDERENWPRYNGTVLYVASKLIDSDLHIYCSLSLRVVFLGLIIDTYIELKFDTDKCITIPSDDSFFIRICVSHQAKK